MAAAFCDRCGGKMYGARITRKKRAKTYIYYKYICSNNRTRGDRHCGYCNVHQKPLVEFLLFKLRNDILAGGNRDELERRIRRRIENRNNLDPDAIDHLRKKLRELDADIVQGAKRIILVPDDIIGDVSAELSRLRRERDRLAVQIKAVDRTESVDIEADVKAALDKMWTLADEIDTAEPARLRELIRRMVSRIELYFDTNPKGNRVERPFSKGFFTLREEYLSGHVWSKPGT